VEYEAVREGFFDLGDRLPALLADKAGPHVRPFGTVRRLHLTPPPISASRAPSQKATKKR
jgi:hypothetical protein